MNDPKNICPQSKPDISEEMVSRWQTIANLMARIVGVPAGLIMKVDQPQIEVLVASATQGNPYKQGERADLNTGLYCKTVMEQRSPLLVPDALKDPDWDHNPDIRLGMISYLGFPIQWPDGEFFGTICVLDSKENQYSKTYVELISQLKELVEAHLGLLYAREHLEDLVEERTAGLKDAMELLEQSEERFRAFMDNNPAAIYMKDEGGRHIFGNKTLLKSFSKKLEEFIGTTSHDFFPQDIAERLEAYDQTVRTQCIEIELDEWSEMCDDEIRWWKEVKFPIQLHSDETLVGGIAIDITTRRQAEEALNERLQFEMLISELSAKLINLPFDQIDQKIDAGLKLISKYLGIDRIALLQFSEDKTELHLTHTYAGDPRHRAPIFLVSEQLPWFSESLRRGKTLRISKIGEMPEEAVAEKQYAKKQGFKSFLTIPMKIAGLTVGAISCSDMKSERTWPDEVVQRLQLISEVFTNVLDRKQKEQKLQNALLEIKKLKDQLQKENIYLREEIEVKYKYGEIVGNADAIKKVLRQVEQVAPTDSNVLILGETGTGKELLARAIHNLSSRKKRTMVTVNCTALPAALIESELFGREKGAYTGALSRQIGRFEAANDSTIFLDEIGELPLEMQVKLLRVLQDGKFERLGSTEPVTVDVRIIAATNQDLAKAVKTGKFRRDLYYRLNVFPITVPLLRDRREDIPLLVWAFVKDYEKAMGKRIESITDRTMDLLYSYSWPGNVRELKNIIERAMILTTGSILRIHRIGSEETIEHGVMLEDAMRDHILKVLENTGSRVSGKNGAAELLGLKESTLRARMKKLGIKKKN
jgi:PAS domain S-box-containing protein